MGFVFCPAFALSSIERWPFVLGFNRVLRLPRSSLTDQSFKYEGNEPLVLAKKEVVKAMDILFDQEYINEIHDKTIRAESRAEGRAEGKAEGLAEGRVEGIAVGKTEGMAIGKTEGMVEGLKKGKVEAKIEIAEKLLKAGIMSLKQIAELTEISIYKLRKIKAQMNVA